MNRGHTHGTHRTHKGDSDLQDISISTADKKGGVRGDVPRSGGNWPPAWMKCLKDEGARLNAPSDSVVILDMSDCWETSRDMALAAELGRTMRGRQCGLYSRGAQESRREGKERKPVSHSREAMTKERGFPRQHSVVLSQQVAVPFFLFF